MLNKIMLVLLVVVMVASGVTGFYLYKQHETIDSLTEQLAVSQHENTVQVESVKNSLDTQLASCTTEVNSIKTEQTSLNTELTSVKSGSVTGFADLQKQLEDSKVNLGNEIDTASSHIATIDGKIDTASSRISIMDSNLNTVSNQIKNIIPGLAADKIYSKVSPSIVQITDGTYTYGTGFLFDTSGLVITASHVIEDISNITVILSDGAVSKATILGSALKSDVAVLKLAVTTSLQPVTMASDSSVTPGDAVITIGHPLDMTNSLTVGVVSQIHRFEDVGGSTKERWLADLIQFDTAVNPGNSGGPLFDENGNVVGMVVATINPVFGSGIGFAVSTARIKTVVSDLQKWGNTSYPFIGIFVNYLTPEYATSLGLKTVNGAVVVNLSPGLPADQAGLRKGDIITAIGSTAINCPDDLFSYFGGQAKVGDKIVIHIIRGNQQITVNVTVQGLAETSTWVSTTPNSGSAAIPMPGI